MAVLRCRSVRALEVGSHSRPGAATEMTDRGGVQWLRQRFQQPAEVATGAERVHGLNRPVRRPGLHGSDSFCLSRTGC